MQANFRIARITAYSTSYNSRAPWEIQVSVIMCNKAWQLDRKQGALGMLYGIDISNAVYGINHNIPAHNPTVNDQNRASKGLKHITLTYSLACPLQAARLGLQVREYGGEAHSVYGDRVTVALDRPHAHLRIVAG